MLGELSANEIETLLESEVIGRIGCHADGRTYVVPVTYAYSEGAVYCHSGDGLKLRLMRKNRNVCFEVDHLDDLAAWKSVIAQGTAPSRAWWARTRRVRRKECVARATFSRTRLDTFEGIRRPRMRARRLLPMSRMPGGRE